MVRAEATAKYVRTSAQKAGLVLDLIRGKDVNLALSALQFSRKSVARDVAKVLRSAVANAQQQDAFGGDVARLFVSKCHANNGPSQKRVRPAPMGRAFRRAAREEMRSADLVHAHWWLPGGLAAPPEAPLVLTVHGTDGAILSRSRIAAAIAKPLFRRARVVTAVSEASAAAIHRATGRAVDAAHIHPMPVDTTQFHRQSGGGGGLVVVGRLTRQKRVDLALRALALLPATVRLRIVGDGPPPVMLTPDRLRDVYGAPVAVERNGGYFHIRVL